MFFFFFLLSYIFLYFLIFCNGCSYRHDQKESLLQMSKGKALFLQFLSNAPFSQLKDGLLKPVALVTRGLTFLNVLSAVQMSYSVFWKR